MNEDSKSVRLSDAGLGEQIHRRRGEGVLINLEPAKHAQPNQCHPNAEACVRKDETCHVIRGWLIEDFSDFSYFNAHSVVQRADGTMFDPTPMNRHCPFVVHWGDEEDFGIQRLNRPRVQYPILLFDIQDFTNRPSDEGDYNFE